MTSLRVWIMILFGWLFVFYNIERLLDPANLMPAIYLVAPLAALPLMVSPRLHLSIPWLLVLPIPVVVSLRLGLEYPISGASLPLTTTEIGCVGLTGVLANQVRQHFEYLRHSAAEAITEAQAAAEAKIAEVWKEAQNTLAAKLDEARAETARVLAAVVARLKKNADQTLTTQFDQPQAEAIELDRVRTEDADEIELDDLRTDIDRFFQRDAEAWRGDAASHKPAARGDSVRGCLTPAVGDSAETNQG